MDAEVFSALGVYLSDNDVNLYEYKVRCTERCSGYKVIRPAMILYTSSLEPSPCCAMCHFQVKRISRDTVIYVINMDILEHCDDSLGNAFTIIRGNCIVFGRSEMEMDRLLL